MLLAQSCQNSRSRKRAIA